MTSKTKIKTTANESKEWLQRCVIAAGSSRRVEEGVDKVESLRVVLL
jgi:hypothetical protein